MIMWVIIMSVILLAFLFCIAYLIRAFSRFTFMERITGDSRKKKFFAGTVTELLIVIIIGVLLGTFNAITVIIYLAAFMLIAELIALLISKKLKKKINYNIVNIVAIAVTVLYLTIAWYQCNNVWVTRYKITTDKDVEKLRIIHFADAHIGTVFSGKELENYVEKMNKENPDIVVITGDFIDDETDKKNMEDACNALSKLKADGGVYYVFGNHDKGYYEESHRGYSDREFVDALTKNNVTVLEDEVIPVYDDYYIIGRKDRSDEQVGSGRKSMKEITASIDKNKYSIVLDHQPNDYDEQEKSGVDLVLSGHTHGGQLLAIKYVGVIIGANDSVYGLEKRGDTNYIVTSGIGDWELLFKTGCRSEYNVIDIE